MGNVKHYKAVPVLPDGYTECEYLESTGTQWIDTNHIYSSNVEIEAKINIQNFSSVLFGCYTTGQIHRVGIDTGKTGTGYYRFGNFATSGEYEINKDAVYKFGRTYFFIDSKQFECNGNDFTNTRSSLYIFGARTASDEIKTSKIKMYYFILKDNTIIRNFIPALDPSGRPCMYDTISKTPFYNQGTGEFLYKVAEKPTMRLVPMVQMYHKGVPYYKDKVMKPRLPEWLQEVEYLESTGIHRIDTGVCPTNQTGYKLIFSVGKECGGFSGYSTGNRNTPTDAANADLSTHNFGFWASGNNFGRFYYGSGMVESGISGQSTSEYLNVKCEASMNAAHVCNIKTKTKDITIYKLVDNVFESPTGYNILLFSSYNNGSTFYDRTNLKIYEYTIYDNDVVIKQFIPCRFKTTHACINGNTLKEVIMEAGKPCMYDIVTGRCFFNLGTGADFIVGEDKDTMVEVSNNTGIVGVYSKGKVVRDAAGLEARLPYEYQEVEYLEATGEQWIDTGRKLEDDKYAIDVTFRNNSPHVNFDPVFGTFGGIDAQNGYRLIKGDKEGRACISAYTTMSDFYPSLEWVDNTIYNVHIERGNVTRNNITINDSKKIEKTHSTSTLKLFHNGQDGSTSYQRHTELYIYHFVLKHDGNIIFNLIPCYRKSDHKAGMYDLVSGEFFVNQGTGADFILGSKV